MRKGEPVGFSQESAHSDQYQLLQNLLSPADIRINGNRPWDPQINNPNIFKRALRNGTTGIGDGYIEGEWDCERLDVLLAKASSLSLDKNLSVSLWNKAKLALGSAALRIRSDPYKVADVHYNLGDTLYENMLDSKMVYSCGYWKEAKTLEEAEEAKLKLICEKLGLKPGMKVLDIGGGWGSLAKYMAENYGVSAVNVTVTSDQVKYANTHREGLPVENRLMKFQDITDEGEYDRVVSVGAFEHFRHGAYRQFMEVSHKALKDDGMLLLHSIGRDTSGTPKPDWITKHIFPESELPNPSSVTRAYEDLFVMEDWHNFGADYDKTIMEWQKNFEKNWEEIKPTIKTADPEKFRRMWNLYLLGSAGLFRARALQLWQIVLSKKGVPGGYQSVR